MMDRYIPALLEFNRKSGVRMLSPVAQTNMAIACMRLMEAQFDELSDPKVVEEMDQKDVFSWLEGIFLFSVTWSVGAAIDTPGRDKFDPLLRELMDGSLSEETKLKLNMITKVDPPARSIYVPIPRTDSIYAWKFIREGLGRWERWTDQLKLAPPIPSNTTFSSIVVPTQDTVRYTHLMNILTTHKIPTLFVGPTGTGKSVYINQFLDGVLFIIIIYMNKIQYIFASSAK